MPNKKFVEYARPLIEGEVPAPTLGGLPVFAQLELKTIAPKLPPRKK